MNNYQWYCSKASINTIKYILYNHSLMKYAYIIIIIVIIYVYMNITTVVEGFSANNMSRSWSSELIVDFINYQRTMNGNQYTFNLEQVQKQASPQEAEELLKSGYWPWSDVVKSSFLEQISSNPIIKIDPQVALTNAQKIYNEQAAAELLGWNTKEGNFLLYGVDLGRTDIGANKIYSSILPNNSIRCESVENSSSQLKKTIYTSPDVWNGGINQTSKMLKPDEIMEEVPGFSFVNNVCNPCSAIDGDFSCPFELKVKSKNGLNNKVNKSGIIPLTARMTACV